LEVNSGHSADNPIEADFRYSEHNNDISSPTDSDEALDDMREAIDMTHSKANKRKFSQLSEASAENSNSTSAAHPHLSKKARKELKKQFASTGMDAFSRQNVASSKEHIRSTQFYLSSAPNSKSSSDNSLHVSNDLLSSTFSHLSASTLDLMGDEQSTILQSKDVLKWNKRKKKFMRETVHSDPFHGQRDEKGELVRVKGENQYEKWRKLRNKRRAKTAGTVDFDDDDTDGGDDDHHHGKTNSNKKSGKKGVKVRNELNSVDEVRKYRKQQQKNKLKNAPKRSTRATSHGRSGGRRK
jgi:hypothetical protein